MSWIQRKLPNVHCDVESQVFMKTQDIPVPTFCPLCVHVCVVLGFEPRIFLLGYIVILTPLFLRDKSLLSC